MFIFLTPKGLREEHPAYLNELETFRKQKEPFDKEHLESLNVPHKFRKWKDNIPAEIKGFTHKNLHITY